MSKKSDRIMAGILFGGAAVGVIAFACWRMNVNSYSRQKYVAMYFEESYTNKDGVKVYTTDVVVEEQEFAESKSAEGQTGTAQPQAQTSQRPQPEQASADGFMSMFDAVADEGLPFN